MVDRNEECNYSFGWGINNDKENGYDNYRDRKELEEVADNLFG